VDVRRRGGGEHLHASHPERSATSRCATRSSGIDHYALLGAPHIRVFAGNAQRGGRRRKPRNWCIAALEECADTGQARASFSASENHGGIVAEPDDLLDIIRAVKSPGSGITSRQRELHTDDPYRDFERCVPYAVNVQMKADIQRTRTEQEPADLPRLVKILREAKLQGYVALEYESEEDPGRASAALLKRDERI